MTSEIDPPFGQPFFSEGEAYLCRKLPPPKIGVSDTYKCVNRYLPQKITHKMKYIMVFDKS